MEPSYRRHAALWSHNTRLCSFCGACGAAGLRGPEDEMFTCVGVIHIFGGALVSRGARTRLEDMTFLAFATLAGWCAVLSGWDVRERRLPNALTGGLALGVFGYAL